MKNNKVAINGLGYIGKLIAKLIIEHQHPTPFRLVAIQDVMSIENAALMIKYNSNHAKLDCNISIDFNTNSLVINDTAIQYYQADKQEILPWYKHDIDLLFECTGNFLTRSKLEQHILSGAKKVLLSAPATQPTDVDKTIIYGINQNEISPKDKLISNASCTTNAVAVVLYPISLSYDITFVDLTTIHGPTTEFSLLDNGNNNLRKCYGLRDNLIPYTTSAAKTILRVLPQFKNKIYSEAFYTSFRGASIMDFFIIIKDSVNSQRLFSELYKFKEASGVLDLIDENVASSCLASNPYSAIVDIDLTRITTLHNNDTAIKIRAWYDHEFGFANRMIDVARYIIKLSL